MERSLAPRRHTNLIGAAIVTTALAFGALAACGSDSTDDSPATPIESPDSSVQVKNGALRNTTTNVPSTSRPPVGGGKPKRP